VEDDRTIFSVGHSNISLERFNGLLKDASIEEIADVRRFPGSKRYPHFEKSFLKAELGKIGIGYVHFPEMGGRRTPSPDSINDRWRSAQFRGYADHMKSEEFRIAFLQLKRIASNLRVACMCAEGLWWQCHRSLICDLLKSEGWKVWHILPSGKLQEHPYSSAAVVLDGRLSYSSKNAPESVGESSQGTLL
jgi:uncharacterized protein (DUF488 family)